MRFTHAINHDVRVTEERKPTALAEWKAAAVAGTALPDALLRKQYVADTVKAEGGTSRRVAFTISTGAVDRDRDTLKADGWQLDSYRKNPVVLWAHDSRSLPIGRAESIRIGSGQLKAVAEFVTADMNPLAESVLKMLGAGFLRATSVGFRPLPGKYKWNDDRGGIDFEEQELLEFSVVPVPANPEALMDAKAAGIDVGPVKTWAERVLDGIEPGLWIPKAAAVFSVLTEPTVAGFDPVPFLAEFEKRGRTLSSANEERIRSARDAGTAIGAALDEVLAQVEEAEPKSITEPVLFVTTAPKEPTFAVDPAVLRAAVVAAVSETVREQISFARGRLD